MKSKPPRPCDVLQAITAVAFSCSIAAAQVEPHSIHHVASLLRPVALQNTVDGGRREYDPAPQTVERHGDSIVLDYAGVISWAFGQRVGAMSGLSITEGAGLSSGVMRLSLALDDQYDRATALTNTRLRVERADGAAELQDLIVWSNDGHRIPARFETKGSCVQIVFDDSQATYPITVDPFVFFIEERLEPPNSWGDARLGTSTAIGDGWGVLGAPGAGDIGQALIVRRQGVQWVPSQEVDPIALGLPSQARNFGTSADLQGRWLVIGAPRESGSEQRVSIFERDLSDAWVYRGSIRGVVAMPVDSGSFGTRVAIDGTTLVVGAPQAEGNEGRVCVYERSIGSAWIDSDLVAVLSGDVSRDAEFGTDVDVSGDTIVVGAPLDRRASGGGTETGSFYVFRRSPAGVWSLEQEPTYPSLANLDTGALAGTHTRIEGDSIVISAVGESQIFSFSRTGTVWSEVDSALISDANEISFASVVLRAGIVAVGIELNQDSKIEWRSLAGLTLLETMDRDAIDLQGFDDRIRGLGRGLSIDGTRALIGAPEARSDEGAGFVVKYGFDIGVPYGDLQALPNSTGMRGFVGGFGSSILAENALILDLNQLPAKAIGFFIAGFAPANVPFREGRLLIDPTGGLVKVGFPALTDNDGCLRVEVDLDFNPDLCLASGASTFLQFVHRDVGGEVNLTKGLQVDWP